MSRKIKIAYISNSAKGEYSGRVKWLKKLSNLKNFEFFFLLPKHEKKYLQKIRSFNIKVIEWDFYRGKNLLKKFLSLFSLYRIIKKENFHILHSFGHECNLLVDIIAKFYKPPKLCIINHITGLGSLFSSNKISYKIAQKILLLLYKISAKKVNKFVFQNQDDYNTFSFIKNEKKILIKGTGVDINEFNPSIFTYQQKILFKKQFGFKEEDLIITFIGRLIKHKGIIELLKAWKMITQKYPSLTARLLIIGDIDSYNISGNLKISHFISSLPNIKLISWQPYETIVKILYFTDIFINPSCYREGLPRVNIEAMAMEKPIITTQTPGCKETVKDGINGFLVPLYSPTKIFESIEKLIFNKNLRERMGKESRKIAINNFSLTVIVNQIMELYYDIIYGKNTY